MKRRILSALLVLCMLASLIPVALFPAAAVEESGQNGGSTQEATSFDYSTLYVGADGSLNTNGGKLVILLTSYLGDSSVSADKTTWNNIAPGATQNGILTGTWTDKGKGGIGYDVANNDVQNALIFTDSTILPVDTYTLELVASTRGYTENADGVTEIYGGTHQRAGIALGRLRGYFMTGFTYADANFQDKNMMIALDDNASVTHDTWNNADIIHGRWSNMLPVYKGEYGIIAFNINLTTSDNTHSYQFLKNGSGIRPTQYSSIADADENTDNYGRFILFDNMAPTAYSVRLYTKPLTEEERLQNHFADVCAFYQLDMTGFDALDAKARGVLYSIFSQTTLDEANYSAVKAEAQNLFSVISAEPVFSDYDKLMVGVDGSATANGGHLTALFTAFTDDGSVRLEEGLWIDKISKNAALFDGDLWQKREGGGVGYDVTAGPKGEGYENGFFGVDTTSPYYTVDDAENQKLILPSNLLVGTLDYTVDVLAQVDTKVYFTDNLGNKTKDIFVNSHQYVFYQATFVKDGITHTVNDIKTEQDVFEDGASYWVDWMSGTQDYARDVYNYDTATSSKGTLALGKSFDSNIIKIPKDTVVTFTEMRKEYQKKALWSSDIRVMAIGNMTAYISYESLWEEGNSVGYAHRFCITANNETWNDASRFSKDSWEDTNQKAIYDGGMHTISYVRDVKGTGASQTQTYNVYKDGALHFLTDSSMTVSTQGSKSYPLETSSTEFFLFKRAPGTVYAIRMYDAILTEDEKGWNHFVDLMAYAEADITAFQKADAEVQAFIVNTMRNTAYTKDAAALEKTIDDIIAVFNAEWEADKSLYVTDGLKILLSSYDGFSTSVFEGENSTVWSNAIDKNAFGILYGKNWHKSEDGGMRYRDTVPQSVADSNQVREYRKSTGQNEFYLSFDYSLLPEEDYTIETIMAPEGITVEDDKGNITRYYDTYTKYGIYNEKAFMLGPFRAMGFACYSHADAAAMERRWMYQNGYGWDYIPPTGRVQVGTDNAFSSLATGQIVSYSILHDFALNEESLPTSVYTILCDSSVAMKTTIDADMYMTKGEIVDNAFELWRGLASTMYSVRVYDRVLTEDERLQNYVADVCYYLDLDTSLLEEALAQIPDKTAVFKAFSSLSFDMSKEEAQSILDNATAGVWITPEGVAVKNNMADAVRYYFSLQYSALAGMMKSGFDIEVGVLLNVGGTEAPNLENNAYGYRYVMFDSVTGARTEYFLDEDTCAITLSYPNGSADAYNKKIHIRTYVKLVSPDGEVTSFYGGLVNSAYAKDNSLFSIYKYMAEQQNVIADGYDRYLKQIVDECYAEEIIYFDSAAEGEGNGTEETPYTNFVDAFDACKDILLHKTTPTHVTLFVEGGTHFVDGILELDFEEMSFADHTFTIEGDFMADEPPTLTTAVEISSSDFEAVEGKAGLYVYQFTPDSEGKFPEFRNFYVEGFTADLAHSTPTTTANGEFPYISRFDRDLPGTFLKAQFYYNEGTIDEHAPAVEFAASPERTDLITSYSLYYANFLALYDLKDTYVNGGLTPAEYSTLTAEKLAELRGHACDALYQEAFKQFHPRFVEVLAGNAKLSSITYTLPTNPEYREGVLYLHIDMVESLRATVEARIAALKAAGTYDPTSSFKTVLADMQIEMNAEAEWNFNIIDVAGVDFEDIVYYEIPNGPNGYKGTVETLVAVYLEKEQYSLFKIPGGYTMEKRLVSLQNAMEFVDENNEYYYDVATGRLYYFNENGVDDTTFAYPTMDNMFIFHNARNLTVTDLTVWGIDDYTTSEIGLAGTQAGANTLGSADLNQTGFNRRSAFTFYDVYGATIQDCYIHDIGGAAIFMEGRVEKANITGNEIENIGDAAIRVAGHKSANEEFSERSGAENVKVVNNYIHQVAQDCFNSPAIYFAACKDVEIGYNTIIGCSYSAVSAGWRWHAATWEEGDQYNVYNMDVHHNYITDFMQNLGDGGAFYFVGGNLKPENPKLVNFIHHNFVVLSQYTGNGLGVHTSCYYFDGATTNWDFYDNIAVNYSAGADRGSKVDASYKDYTMYVRRTQRNYIFFMQWVAPIAYSYNIHSRNNHAFNVRSTDPERQFKECYSVDGSVETPYDQRGIVISNTSYYSGTNKLNFSSTVKGMIEETGSYMCRGDWGWLINNEY